jgi:hypothetical protein
MLTVLDIGIRCKHEFCWLCMASWTLIRDFGNAYHKLTCIYHTNQLNAAQEREEIIAEDMIAHLYDIDE